MGENPSEHKGPDYPVEKVSWEDAIYFCNKLSARRGLTPVYAVNGETDVSKWGYIPHKKKDFLSSSVTQNTKANGYRLPTEEEFYCAKRGGEEFKYAGSDNLNQVSWNKENSGNTIHPVALKKKNGYGLYDMDGNVREWCWDKGNDWEGYRLNCGGSYKTENSEDYVTPRPWQMKDLGFRIVCSAKQKLTQSSRHHLLDMCSHIQQVMLV